MDPDFLCYAVTVSLVRIILLVKLFASRMEMPLARCFVLFFLTVLLSSHNSVNYGSFDGRFPNSGNLPQSSTV